MTDQPPQPDPDSPLHSLRITEEALQQALAPLRAALPTVEAAFKQYEANFRAHRFIYQTHAEHNWNALRHQPRELEAAIAAIERALIRLEQDTPILSPTPLPLKPQEAPA